jgi:hypothetical protein
MTASLTVYMNCDGRAETVEQRRPIASAEELLSRIFPPWG